ncbi:MAG: transcription antitermination factor NusB [Verrucomicrobiota bacterium]
MDETSSNKPPSARRQNRVAAMQFLYMCESNPPQEIADSLRIFFENREKERDFYSFGEELAAGAWEKHEDVDVVIKEYARNWTINRIAKVDLAILRLAIYELNYRLDIPPIVTINEAIDLAKEYSDPEARRFVNGILDRVKGTLQRPLRTAATK